MTRILDLRHDAPAENHHEFVAGLGTYWTEKFEDSNVVATLVDLTQDSFIQADIDLKEVVSVATSIATAPTHHLQLWFRLTLRESEQTTDHPLIPAYGAAGPYGNGLVYGQRVPQLWTWEVSADLSAPRCLTNSPVEPTFVGLQNQAFYFRQGVLGLAFDPFRTTGFEVTSADGDRSVQLWLRCSSWDTQLFQNQYAVPLGFSGPSSEAYAQMVEAAWESRLRGPSDRALFRLIAGATGVPLTRSTGETVEVVATQGTELVVCTDRQVYRFPSTHVPVVAVGDVLTEGQALTDALKVKNVADLRSGSEDVVVPPEMFAPDFGIREPLRFPNARVAVGDGGLASGGERVVTFPLVGEAADVSNFRRHAAHVGLYRAFDVRGPGANTVPTAAQLIPTVNPAIDLIKKHTAPHLILMYGDQTRWPSHPDLQTVMWRQLDLVVPPHARIIPQDLDLSESVSSVSLTSSSGSSLSESRSTVSSWSTPSSASTRSSRSTTSGSTPSTSSRSLSSQSTSSASAVSASSVSGSTDSSSSTATASTRSSRSSGSASSVSVSSVSSNSSSSSTSSASTASSASSATADVSSASSRSASSASSNSSSTSYLLHSTSSRSSPTDTASSASESSRSASSQTLSLVTTSSSSGSTPSSLSTRRPSDSSRSESSRSDQSASTPSLSTPSTQSLSTLSTASASTQSLSTLSTASASTQSLSTRSTASASTQSFSGQTFSSRSSRSESSRSTSSVSLSTASSRSVSSNSASSASTPFTSASESS